MTRCLLNLSQKSAQQSVTQIHGEVMLDLNAPERLFVSTYIQCP